uniref:Uncharacterized protein n=1 Tax=Oryza brachyantha TaxID=4533 RepID=J3MD95_ORYBR
MEDNTTILPSRVSQQHDASAATESFPDLTNPHDPFASLETEQIPSERLTNKATLRRDGRFLFFLRCFLPTGQTMTIRH